MFALLEASLSALLVVSLKVVVLAIVAGTCLFCLRIRDSNLQHRVWTAVLLAMLLLPALAWVTPSVPLPEISAMPLASLGGNSGGAESSAVADSKPASLRSSAAMKSNIAQEDLPTEKNHLSNAKTVGEIGNQTRATESDSMSTAWVPWVFAAYAVGLAVMLGRLFLGIWSARRLAKQAQPIPSLGSVHNDSGQYDSGRYDSGRYDIAASDAIRVPLTVGIVRPRVLLPADWPLWSAEMLASVLRHEQSHIDRCDLLVALFAEINRCVYWFHPLAWFLRKRLAALAEQSCDDLVISASGDRSEYAGHLLNIAGRMSGDCMPEVMGRVAPLGVSMARTPQVESRIDAILDAGRPLARRLGWRRAAVLAAVVLPLVLFIASVHAVEESENKDADQAASTEKKETVDDEGGNDSVPLEEGDWVKFQVEITLGKATEKSSLTIVILDQVTQQEQVCRWIETIQQFEGDKETVMTRLLVPEVHLQIGGDVLDKALVLLQRIGEQEPVDYSDTDRSKMQTDINLIMPIRYDNRQPHEPEPVDFNVSREKVTISLPGWTNRRIEADQDLQGFNRELLTRRWVMESASPFGVLKAQETTRLLNAGKTVVRTTIATVADGGNGARSQFRYGPLPPFTITPGWEWAFSPQSCNYSSMATRGMVIMIDKDAESLTLRIAYSSRLPDGEYTIKQRPVAFDAERNRYEFGRRIGGSSGDVGMYVFKLSAEAPIDRITDIGIERLTKQGLKVFAESAAKPAREAGLEPLPFPTVGQPYTFSVTTTDNKTLRSKDFRGKVVLIDCWATWCGPCMVKMPKLKSLYEKWHSDGFEVIGINFDKSAEAMQKTVDAKELPWPQVLVPADSKKRELWKQASGITGIPRLLLLDRQGNLHSDQALDDLEKLVEQLMREK